MNSGELVLGSQKLDLSLVISTYSVVSESSKGYGEAGEQIRFDFTTCAVYVGPGQGAAHAVGDQAVAKGRVFLRLSRNRGFFGIISILSP